MVLCRGRSPIKKNKKNKTIKNAKGDCKKTENKFLKKKENIAYNCTYLNFGNIENY
jgi:hypothetical protein